jgi:hypothetical protein
VKETLHIVTIVMPGYERFTAIADNRNGADTDIVATLTPAVPVKLDRPTIITPDQIVPEGNLAGTRPFLVDWNMDGILDTLMSDGSGIVYLLLGTDPVLGDGIPTYEGILLDSSLLFGVPVLNAIVFAVDWDNDADFDLLLGNADGTVLLAINAGDQETPAFFDGGAIQVLGANLMMTGDSAPAVADWDNDGDKDLLVGCATGTLGLYINTGTDEAPEFTLEQFVAADGSQLVVPSGHSVPIVTDWDSDGLSDLLVGSQEGLVYLYLNAGSESNPALQSQGAVTYYFNKKKTVEVNTGPYSTPYFADGNGDGVRDLISGNEYGEIFMFWGMQPQ